MLNAHKWRRCILSLFAHGPNSYFVLLFSIFFHIRKHDRERKKEKKKQSEEIPNEWSSLLFNASRIHRLEIVMKTTQQQNENHTKQIDGNYQFACNGKKDSIIRCTRTGRTVFFFLHVSLQVIEFKWKQNGEKIVIKIILIKLSRKLDSKRSYISNVHENKENQTLSRLCVTFNSSSSS